MELLLSLKIILHPCSLRSGQTGIRRSVSSGTGGLSWGPRTSQWPCSAGAAVRATWRPLWCGSTPPTSSPPLTTSWWTLPLRSPTTARHSPCRWGPVCGRWRFCTTGTRWVRPASSWLRWTSTDNSLCSKVSDPDTGRVIMARMFTYLSLYLPVSLSVPDLVQFAGNII